MSGQIDKHTLGLEFLANEQINNKYFRFNYSNKNVHQNPFNIYEKTGNIPEKSQVFLKIKALFGSE